MNKRTTYNGGSMTNFMGRDFQLKMHEIMKEANLDPVTPSLNKSINDKKVVGNKDIAKMIVAKDSEGIINSSVRVFNNLGTTGSSIEIGQVLGMNDFANIIKQLIEKREEEGVDANTIIDELWCVADSEMNKDFILFDVDVRSHDEAESGYRRSKGFHQFERGVGMRLMRNDNGYLRLEEEAIPKLHELGKEYYEPAFEVKFDDNDELVVVKGLKEKLGNSHIEEEDYEWAQM